jgi:hypothetical protein
VTLLPQVARRLGAATPKLYPPLARLAPLRSHRLAVYRHLDTSHQQVG